MIRNYLKIAMKVLLRRKFFTFIPCDRRPQPSRKQQQDRQAERQAPSHPSHSAPQHPPSNPRIELTVHDSLSSVGRRTRARSVPEGKASSISSLRRSERAGGVQWRAGVFESGRCGPVRRAL